MIALEELYRVEFLRNLGREHASQLAALAEPKEYPAGAEVFRQGEDSPYLYFVLDGEVALEVQVSGQGAVEIHRSGPGEFLGWSPALGRRAMTATGRATGPTRLAAFEIARVLELCERDPSFGSGFYRQVSILLASRLDDTRGKLARHLARRSPAGQPALGSD
jgi:CRP-like cAMP-binding protein